MSADAVAKRIVYKAYTTATITPGAPPAQGTDPGATGGQTLRYLTCNANLQKSNFRSNEKRPSQQIYDARHGSRNVPLEISGELSPKTYQDFFAAVLRGAWAAAISKTNTEFTSMTISAGVATVGGSTWAAQGFMVGDVIRFASMSVAANNAKNFVIASLNGTAATLLPAPTDNTSDTTFTVATCAGGRKLFAPLTSLVDTLWLLEEYSADTDVDLADLTKQFKFGGFRLSMPAEGIVGVSFNGLGRDLERLVAGSSPFFAAPTAVTTTNVLTSNGGQLLVSGVAQAIINGLDLSANIGVTSGPAAFSQYHPDIVTGTLDVSGSISGEFLNNTLAAMFDAETEIEISLLLTESTADAANYISIFLPRVKLMNFQKSDSGQGAITFTANFQALEKATTTGYNATTIAMIDSQSA